MADNNMNHDETGFTPFQLTFGRDANLPSMLSTTPSVKYQEILSMWKERNEGYLEQARQKIQIQKEKYKKLQNSKIALPQEIYESGDLVKFINNIKEHKLSPSWKGSATVLDHLDNNNYIILFNSVKQRIHANQLMPYYV